MNLDKSEVMRWCRDILICLNGEDLDEVEYFRSLGVDMAMNRTFRAEMNHKVG